MPLAVEAAWVTGRWESLDRFMSRFHGSRLEDFNMSIASILDCLRKQDGPERYHEIVRDVRESIASSMNASTTASLRTAHDQLLRSHILTDLDMIVNASSRNVGDHQKLMSLLDRRLNMIGAFSNDKQYLLGIRRAAMVLTQ